MPWNYRQIKRRFIDHLPRRIRCWTRGFFCLADEPRSIRFVEGHSLPVSISRPDNIVRTSRGTTGSALLLLDLIFRLLSLFPSRSSRACILCQSIKVHYLSSVLAVILARER